jgi:hydroxypyruvate isomerase
MDRRDFIAAGLGLAAGAATHAARQANVSAPAPAKLRQSVCRWCLARHDLDQVCDLAVRCGIQSVELLDPPDIERVRERGLKCAIANGPCSITEGLNRLENHESILRRAEALFPRIAKAGCEMVIMFAGNRAGLDDTTGLWNCAAGVKRMLPLAKEHGLTMALELLNSRVDHPDHMGDRVEWGAELCRAVLDDRFGILFDVYHMQIMGGDITRYLTTYRHWIRHIHTAGVPGRGPLGRDQELNYAPIIRALHEAGYRGWVGHEFIARGDVETELKAAVAECLG